MSTPDLTRLRRVMARAARCALTRAGWLFLLSC